MSYNSIAIAYGDGIGPEIMQATMSIIAASKAVFKVEPIELGKEVYEKGWEFGIADSSWQVIERNKILLKAPLTTPQGKGYKSLNVKLRKVLGLYLNIRPVKSFINDDGIDMVIIRENDEDLYSGIEYQNTVDSAECAKIITYGSSSRVIRYAFDLAKHNNRKQVACMVKDNIMKMTDGIFHNEFKRIKEDYKKIETKSYIIDIGSALIAKYPQMFDVVVTSNLYGDIISDIAAEVTGSVGMAGGINLGKDYAMFEAVHGSAPDIAGLGIANPSGLLQGAISMLNY
ncbi:MAG: isocitrate/isopropylmalate family dehydrogenase, partial [Anaplasmataceae bacterium]|nr:isocitrate/isopropylmalate family dehydrogenase [Anaplasmataceae bacterium]